MNRAPGRRWIALGGLLVLFLLGFGVWRNHHVIALGVGYKAKMICSGVFVAGRDLDAVLTDLHVDDLALLRYIPVSVDRETKTVTTRAPGLFTRRAVYRDGLGCALIHDGPDRLPIPRRDLPQPKPISDDLVLAVVATPGNDRLDRVIALAFEEPDIQKLRRTNAVVVLHRGKLVAEKYAPGMSADTPQIGWSMAKSVMSALAGILVQRGRLRVDAPVPVPEWAGDERRTITLDHLLRMSSGLEFDESMSSANADVMRMLFGTEDASGFALAKWLSSPPGTTWRYSSGTTNIVARVLRNVLQNDDEYLDLPQRALFEPIGMKGATLEADGSGTFVGSSFMYATARDWARFGQLYLQDGMWSGERVLPAGWVAYTTSPAPADPLKGYGAHFWLDVPDGYRGPECRLPLGTFHAAGHEGQFVTIVPSREAVIVRLGRTRVPGGWNQCAFVADVLAALAG